MRLLGQRADFNPVFCRSLLLVGWMPAGPNLAFLSVTAFVTQYFGNSFYDTLP